MHPDLTVQRRVLARSYRLYLDADRSWSLAVRESKSWFPLSHRPPTAFLGDPGSRLRRLHDARERALQRLLVARSKLEQARRRLEERERTEVRAGFLLLTF